MVSCFTVTLCILGNFSCFVVICLLFSKLHFSKLSFRNTISVSKSLYPDQDLRSVGPDLVQTVYEGYQQRAKVAAGKERVAFFSVRM